jgi:hypothetical protein
MYVPSNGILEPVQACVEDEMIDNVEKALLVVEGAKPMAEKDYEELLEETSVVLGKMNKTNAHLDNQEEEEKKKK